MIHFCSCSKNSFFSPENTKRRENLKSCKICGGRRPVDGRLAQERSMLSTGRLELDPHLSWKTASNGRQRAVRKARTSFTGANGKNFPAKSLKASKDLTDKYSKGSENMPVSESEKVGVSILGRRFSDTLGSVPIKKRRFLLPHSPSPPCHSPSRSDDSCCIRERKAVTNQGAVLQHHPFNANSISELVPGQKGNFGFEETDLKGVNTKICDAADFSGISILAAAACDSKMRGESMNIKCSLSNVPTSEVQEVAKENASIDCISHEKEEAVLHTCEDLCGGTDSPFELSSSSVLASKETNDVKSDGSHNLETPINSFNGVQKTTESSSCDVNRFHWDLNTVADAWEGHDESLNSNLEVTNNFNEDGDQKEKVGILEPSMDQVGFGDTKNVPTGDPQIVDAIEHFAGSEEEVIHVSEVEIEDKPAMSTDNSAAASKESEPLHSRQGNSPAMALPLKDAVCCEAYVYEETKRFVSKDNHCSVGDLLSTIKGATVNESVVVDSSLSFNGILAAAKGEAGKVESCLTDFPPIVETENRSSLLVSCDNAHLDIPSDVSGLPEMGRMHSESGTIQMSEVTSQANKPESTCIDSGTIQTDENLLVCRLPDGLHAYGNTHNSLLIGSVNSGANEDMIAEDETACCNANKFEGKDECQYETTAAEMEMDTHSDDMDIARSDSPTDNMFKVSASRSVGITSGSADASPPLNSEGDLGSASNPAQVSVENHLDEQLYPDSSQNVADQEPGMEKVDFLGDDDSQYEDGEFRANCWLDDGEEVETDNVDYGSDRDTNICDAASNFSSVNRQVNNTGLLDREAGKDTQITSRSFMNCSPLANASDTGPGKSNTGSAMGTSLHGNRTKSNDAGDKGFFKEAVDARRSIHSASFRKMSGWDQLPGGCSRGSSNGMTESRSGFISRNHNDASLGPSRAGDPINRAVGSSLRRELSSRGEWVRSSDTSHRSDRSYGRQSRFDDRNGNPQAVRDRDRPQSAGRDRPSMNLQGRGKGDHGVDSSYHGNNRHDSSGYYGSSSFSHHGSRNAAAAAVAKVESNGFVVAPDGTIVKADGPGSNGHLIRRPVKGPSQNTDLSPIGRGSPVERERSFVRPSGAVRSREMSPDRPRPVFAGRGKLSRYDPRMDGACQRERYRELIPDEIVDSASMHRTISRRDHSFSPHRGPRDHSFSPHRRPFHLSRSDSRSPSRSRTRSPRRYASPRGRSYNGMNGDPGLRQHSRSPNFRSDARMDRSRAGVGCIGSYSPLARNHTSPPHTSRWINRRNEASEHFRDYECRQGPRKSPPARVFSRDRRFDLMDSPERLKPDKYCRPANSGRFSEFVGFDRGSRHGVKGDNRREHGDRYEMLHPARRYVNNDNMEQLRYDDENSLIAPNPWPKSLEFQRRGNPRAFDRGTDRPLGDSPRRYKEKCHVRNGGDGNHNANYKSFGMPEGDDSMDAQRRLED